MRAAVYPRPGKFSYDIVTVPVIEEQTVSHAYDIFKNKEDNFVKVIMETSMQ
jgi:hypothetical protein